MTSRRKLSRAEFVSVYEEHVWDVYGFLGYRLTSREDAEDLTQKTFERALRAWHRFDPERASARTWLITIARNLLIDHFRTQVHQRGEVRADAVDESALGVHQMDQRGLGPSAELQMALQSLKQRDREVVALRFGGDMTGKEIADLLDLSLANVQQILSRSLRQLRSKLEPTSSGQLGGEGSEPSDSSAG